ncbi:MAG: flagellar biosynthetic protein FliO [Oscillospiraceae bacterium]|jgi:flagellar biogenesis protein FliO|nr:flagellar biosynthetic protein FliO [Oscillospiraceae bacterium]
MQGAALFAAGTAVVIIAAYCATYFIGSRGMRTRAARDIRLRDHFAVSKDKSFALVEVRGRVYLVALTNGGAALLDTYDLAEFEASAPAPAGRMSFRDALSASAREAGGLPGFIASKIHRRGAGKDEPGGDGKGDGKT